jgi:hypothetical protein
LGAVQPAAGLSVLAAAMHTAFPPFACLAPSPILWPNILRYQPSQLFHNFAAQLPTQLARQTEARAALAAPSLPASMEGQSTSIAEVQSRILSIVEGLMGSHMEAEQSFMEVRVPGLKVEGGDC